MELIYFISGIITVGVGYGTWLLTKVRSSHKELLRSNQHSTNISSARYGEMREKVDEMNAYVRDIESQMSNDGYMSTQKLSKRMTKLEKSLDTHKKRLDVDIRTSDTSFSKAFTEIQTLKKNLKALGQDPNFLNRY